MKSPYNEWNNKIPHESSNRLTCTQTSNYNATSNACYVTGIFRSSRRCITLCVGVSWYMLVARLLCIVLLKRSLTTLVRRVFILIRNLLNACSIFIFDVLFILWSLFWKGCVVNIEGTFVFICVDERARYIR